PSPMASIWALWRSCHLWAKMITSAVLQSIPLPRIGVVTRSGSLLPGGLYLLPGQWFMQQPSLARTGHYYWYCLPYSYVRSASITALYWKIPNGVLTGTGAWRLVVQSRH